MKTIRSLILLPLLAVSSACDADTAELRASNASGPSSEPTCVACHRGERSFAGKDAGALAKQIRAILDGDVMHPPLGLDDESDEAIAALAETLTGG